MNAVELVSICIRIYALTLVISDLNLIFQLAEMLRKLPPTNLDPTLLLLGSAIAIGVLIVAAVFWVFPLRIARFVVPKGIDGELKIGLTAEQLEVAALSLLGIWVLINAIPQLLQLVVWAAASWSEDPSGGTAGLVLRLVQITFGSLLLFRSVGIRRIVNTLRTKGT